MTLAALAAVVVALAAFLAGAPPGRGLDARELRSLYERCAARAMGLAYRILRDREEAEDVVQDTFLDLWRRAADYDPTRASLPAWALLVARSRALDRLRARSAALRAADARAREPDPPPTPALELAERREERDQVLAALASIPPEQRDVVELAYFEGLTHSEIATRTGLPVGTVKTRIRLAMEKLNAALARTLPQEAR